MPNRKCSGGGANTEKLKGGGGENGVTDCEKEKKKNPKKWGSWANRKVKGGESLMCDHVNASINKGGRRS